MKRILVVDDSRSWVEFNKSNLLKIFERNVEIDCAICAKDAYELIYNTVSMPYDIIVTDLQMENDFGDKYAGEWLVEQIQLLTQYSNTRIVIISASYNIRHIAESLNVEYLPKSVAAQDTSSYKMFLQEN